MGCRLPKLKKEERTSPGNIYSTLRRPQVETKVGVAYTYHFLDFLLGKEELPVSSVLSLSSVRELPVQVRELYSEGFVLVAVHPFVHACGPDHAHVQRQLHRAVLVRETHSWERRELRWCRHRLETDVCLGGNQEPDPEIIQSYVKKIQDVAEQGVVFVGFLQQPGPGLSLSGPWDPDLSSLHSLHSSPSPIHRGLSCAASPSDAPGERQPQVRSTENKQKYKVDVQEVTQVHYVTFWLCFYGYAIALPGMFHSVTLISSTLHLFNYICSNHSVTAPPCLLSCVVGSQLFALYNHTEEQDSSLRFYSLRVPLWVHREAGLVTEVDAHWLDHMTQHFSSGAQLVDGFFHVSEENDSGVAQVDSVFIFQSSAQSVNASYDAIVVEQWTVVD
ncbi:hypothetical protein NL108_018015, partial [Boleophthalmus pectinirostris]